MSQNVQNENINNKESNNQINKAEIINKQNKTHKRSGTDYAVIKIINNDQKSNEDHQKPPNEIKSNPGDSQELQFFNSVLRLMNRNKKNGDNKLKKNDSNTYNMSSPYKEDKNNEPNKEKENNDEGHNNGDDEFIEKNTYTEYKRNPYQDNKNDVPNNEKENNDYQNVEKEVFNSQCSINEQTNEDNNNNDESNINSSPIIVKDNNELNNEGNSNNFKSNEINKNDNFNQEEKNNSLNNQTNKDDNNNNSNVINNSSIKIQDKERQINFSKISQSEIEEKINYSHPDFNYNFSTDDTKINNDSKVPSNLDNDKDNISHNEKNVIKIDNNINEGSSGNSNNQKVQMHILDRYKKVSKTGLINLGDSSYLNAVLQSLGHVRHFASYFLNPKNQELIGSKFYSMPLAFITQRLFTHLYPYPESNTIEIYSPKCYLDILSFLKSPFGKKRGNPNDLLIFILNTLHNELNSNKSKINKNKMPCDYFSVDSVIQNGIIDFTNYNKSKISDVVSWFQMNESNCTNCWKSIYCLNPFNTYDLDIKNTYEYYLKNGKNNINLYDCLFYGAIPKPGNFYCYNCKSRTKSFKQSRIYSPPNVFIFLLDRGINFNENYTHIPFIVEEKIDLSDFVIKQNTPKHYRLTGIVSFNLKEQKYVSYCQSPIDNNWYLYNDEKVNLVFCEDILNNKNDNDIPCILYYKPI